jgi:ribonucleoside-diphosphate reductase beta chain
VDAEFRDEIKSLFLRAVELEYRYAEDTMPRGVLGLNAPMFKGYLRFIANRRAQQIGLMFCSLRKKILSRG